MEEFRLCLVTDEQAMMGRPFFEIVEAAVQGGVSLVQLREKNLETRAFLDRAFELKSLLSNYDIPLIINDRLDIALAVEADGVHVGQSDMPVELVRKLIPHDTHVGLSIEKLAQGIEANDWDVSYFGIGPIYPTPTKMDASPAMGLAGITELKQHSDHFLMAIGGVNLDNIREVIRAGADGVAVVSAICSASNPEATAGKLRQMIKEELDNRQWTTDRLDN